MYIFFGDDIAEKLKENYLVLELEEIESDNKKARAYCVVPADKISLAELPNIPKYRVLHRELVNRYEQGDYDFCRIALVNLMGKFGGEVDSFYQELESKITHTA